MDPKFSILSIIFTIIIWFLVLPVQNVNYYYYNPLQRSLTRIPNVPQLRQSILSGFLQRIKPKALDRMGRLVEYINNSTNLDRLKDCYESNYDGEDLNFLKKPIPEIVEKYFRKNLDLLSTPQEIGIRIFTFILNIRKLLRMILKCLRSTVERPFSRVGLTSLSHLTSEEYNLMLNPSLNSSLEEPKLKGINSGFLGDCPAFPMYPKKTLPESFDWTHKNMVTDIRNQKTCGSCFIFSALATLESAYLIKQNGSVKPSDVDWSEQHVLDCVKPKSCQTGGLPEEAWSFLMKKGPVDEHIKPYQNKQYSHECRLKYPESSHKVQLKGWCLTRRPDDYSIKLLLTKYGPLFGAVDATNNNEWQFLKGPFHGKCGTRISHAITIIGYNEKYWIIKNSWGTKWGVNGLLFLPRNKCGINTIVGMPIIKSVGKVPEPKKPSDKRPVKPRPSSKPYIEWFPNFFPIFNNV